VSDNELSSDGKRLNNVPQRCKPGAVVKCEACFGELVYQRKLFSLASAHFKHFWKAELSGISFPSYQELKVLGLLCVYKTLLHRFKALCAIIGNVHTS